MAAAVGGDSCIQRILSPKGSHLSIYVGNIAFTEFFDDKTKAHSVMIRGDRVTLQNFSDGSDSKPSYSEKERLYALFPKKKRDDLDKQLKHDATEPQKGNPFVGYAIYHRVDDTLIGKLSFKEIMPPVHVSCQLLIDPDYRHQGYGTEVAYLATHLACWIQEKGFKTGCKSAPTTWTILNFSLPKHEDPYFFAAQRMLAKLKVMQEKDNRRCCFIKIEKLSDSVRMVEDNRTLARKRQKENPTRVGPPLPPLEQPRHLILCEETHHSPKALRRKSSNHGREVPLLPYGEYADPEAVPEGVTYGMNGARVAERGAYAAPPRRQSDSTIGEMTASSPKQEVRSSLSQFFFVPPDPNYDEPVNGEEIKYGTPPDGKAGGHTPEAPSKPHPTTYKLQSDLGLANVASSYKKNSLETSNTRHRPMRHQSDGAIAKGHTSIMNCLQKNEEYDEAAFDGIPTRHQSDGAIAKGRPFDTDFLVMNREYDEATFDGIPPSRKTGSLRAVYSANPPTKQPADYNEDDTIDV